jgi:NTP pyrophosphatase (non-canonical NTP hydrolase)
MTDKEKKLLEWICPECKGRGIGCKACDGFGVDWSKKSPDIVEVVGGRIVDGSKAGHGQGYADLQAAGDRPLKPSSAEVYSRKKASKPPLASLYLPFLEEMAKVTAEGDKKHADCNYNHVDLSLSDISSAALRHVFEYVKGNELDTGEGGDGLHHLAHAANCCMMLFYYSNTGRGKNDLRFVPAGKMVEVDLQQDVLSRITSDIVQWADKQYPTRKPENALKKLAEEEIPELRENPDDAGELADVLILTLDLCNMHGHDPATIIAQKMEKNRARHWVVLPDGTMHHDDGM